MEVKERGILFSAPMVRALLAGTKTQTRRIVKVQPERRHPERDEWYWHGGSALMRAGYGAPYVHTNLSHVERAMLAICPYGQPGDRLWVRETIALHNKFGFPLGETPQINPVRQRVWSYAADGIDTDSITMRRPAIHMPRWASRITLDLTAVRVERLQDISEADAIAEGVRCGIDCPDHRTAYGRLWEQINGCGSWRANPWVRVLEFKRL